MYIEEISEYHTAVLYKEVMENLITNLDGVYVDGTLGGGGHSEGILKSISENGKLISIDQDQNAINFCKKKLVKYKGKISVFKNNFSNIDSVVYAAGYDNVDGILMDIGVSSKQLDDPERGFSYKFNTRLDMRMDKTQKLSAYEIINEYEEEKISKIIYEYGEERYARKIAKYIVYNRENKPIETTGDLVSIIKKAIKGHPKKHPAKKTFQAIRIEVNRELEVLTDTIDKAVNLLKSGGRLAIITFHSLEDRIVKQKFKKLSTDCICPPELFVCRCDHHAKVKRITKKPIIPSGDELKRNSRSHSSKLRVVEKL